MKKARNSPYFLLLSILLPAAAPFSSYALTLDIPVNIEIKGAKYSNLIYKGNAGNQSYIIETAGVGFIAKNIALEKTLNSSVDVGLSLKSYSSGASTSAINSPQFQSAINRYPQNNGTLFVDNAYIKIYKFLNKDITATLGRQPFVLGGGITLSDDGLGFPGVLVEFNKPLSSRFKTDIFAFRIWNYTRMVKILGTRINFPAEEGLWQVYTFADYDEVPQTLNGINIKSRTKIFSGLRYFVTKNKINFDGEFILQRGSKNKLSGGEIDYKGYGFLIKGEWPQRMGFLGKVRAHLAYGKSSGNASAALKEDREFFPTFGHKYSAFERSGYGEILGASIYDILPTSSTTNGFPEGISGMRLVNAGITFPYKKAFISADYTVFKGLNNYMGGSLRLGSEFDLKLSYSAGKNIKIKVVYATFNPKWQENLETTKLTSFSIQARF